MTARADIRDHVIVSMADSGTAAAMCGMVVTILLLRRKRRRRNRQLWVKEWINKRPRFGAYYKLLNELHALDQAGYKNLIRMDPATFDELPTKVAPHITYQDTNIRQAIPPEERLVLTLRFLATGEEFILVNYKFNIVMHLPILRLGAQCTL